MYEKYYFFAEATLLFLFSHAPLNTTINKTFNANPIANAKYHAQAGEARPNTGSKIVIEGAVLSIPSKMTIAPVIPPDNIFAENIGNGAASAYGIAASVAQVAPIINVETALLRSPSSNSFGATQHAIAAAIGGII